jgi:hypothetical protein
MIAKESDRVISFSIKPTNSEALLELSKLKSHAQKTGVSFSFFMLRGIKLINKELNLK